MLIVNVCNDGAMRKETLHVRSANSGNWESQLDLDGTRVIAMAAAEHRLLEAEYDEYTTGNSSGAACCRSAALIFMELLLLHHALAIASAGGDEDVSTFFTLLLRTAGFLLPCYIMAQAMNILQNQTQRQDAVMTAAEVAFLMQARRARGLGFAGVASAS